MILTSIIKSQYFPRYFRYRSVMSTNVLAYQSYTRPQPDVPLEKPDIDDRLFKQIVLNNGIPVTLVHDALSEKASCSLSVNIGASADTHPGVAHLTEHAVFLGSRKYPVENAYKNFLNKNGGASNASTSMEHTTYKFAVNWDKFDSALDIFSQFFKGPLFDANAISREIMAVDSEDSKNRILDSRRMLQVLKNEINPDSKYAKFSTGNLNTLCFGVAEQYGKALSSCVRSFHSKYYTPESMAVCIVGPQPIEELESMASTRFADIQSMPPLSSADAALVESYFGAADEIAEEPAAATTTTTTTTTTTISNSVFTFSKDGVGKLIRLRPVKDVRDLVLIWELPYSRTLYRNSPTALLGSLLGHEGEGSVFAYLQDQHWATALSAGTRTHFPGFTLFQISVSLTPEGLEHWQSIVGTLYQYISLLSTANAEELHRMWEEMRAERALNFKFKQKSGAYECSPTIAENMLEVPLHHILSRDRLIDGANIELIREYISKLTPANSITFLRSPTFTHLSEDNAHLIDDVIHKLRNEPPSALLSSSPASAASVAASSTTEGVILSATGTGNEAVGAPLNLSDVNVVDEAAFASTAHVLHRFVRTDEWQQSQLQRFLNASTTTPAAVSSSQEVSKAESQNILNGKSKLLFEPYYGIPYEMQYVNKEQFSAKHLHHHHHHQQQINLHLPAVNDYICYELMNRRIDLPPPPPPKTNTAITSTSAPSLPSSISNSIAASTVNDAGAGAAESPPINSGSSPNSGEKYKTRSDVPVLLPIDVIRDLILLASRATTADGSSCGEEVLSNEGGRSGRGEGGGVETGTARRGGRGVTHGDVASVLPRMQLWHSEDQMMHQPRSILYCFLRSSGCNDGHPVLSLLGSTFSQVVARKYYNAETAGLYYSFSAGRKGISMSYHGYSPKLLKLVDAVTKDVGDIDFWTKNVTPLLFDSLKDKMLRALRSWNKNRPDSQCDSLLTYLMEEGSWLPEQRLAACEAMDFAYFQDRVRRVLTGISPAVWEPTVFVNDDGHAINNNNNNNSTGSSSDSAFADGVNVALTEQPRRAQHGTDSLVYLHGDLDIEAAKKAVSIIAERCFRQQQHSGAGSDDANSSISTAAGPKTSISSSSSSSNEDRARMLPCQKHITLALPCFNTKDPNSALLTYFQADSNSPRCTALILLLRRQLSEPAFTELRTKQQLGYIVSLASCSFGTGLDSIRGLSIRILSKRYSPVHMESVLGDFLSSQHSLLSSLSDEEVATLCEAIIKSLEDPPTTYTEEAAEFYGRIKSNLPFNWTELVIEELRAVKAVDVVEAANKWLYDESMRKSVSVMLFGNSDIHQADLQAMKDTVAFIPDTATACSKDEASTTTATSSSSLATKFFPPYSAAAAVDAKQVRECIFTIDGITSARDSLKFL